MAHASPVDGMATQSLPTSIVFLDVDGVLNSHASREASETDLPDAECLGCLKRLIKATGSAIVLSSTWRFSADDIRAIETALHISGIGPLFGATPYWDAVGSAEARGAEILRWLVDSAPSSVVAWVALDDLDLSAYCAAIDDTHFELTHDEVGLTDANVDAAIEKLHMQRERIAEQVAEVAARKEERRVSVAAAPDSAATPPAASPLRRERRRSREVSPPIPATTVAKSEWMPAARQRHLEAQLQNAVRWCVAGAHGERDLPARCATYLSELYSEGEPPHAAPAAPEQNLPTKADVTALAQRLSEGLNVAAAHPAIDPLRVLAAHLVGEPTAGLAGPPALSLGEISHGPMIQVLGTTATIWVRGTARGGVQVRCWRSPRTDAVPTTGRSTARSSGPKQRRSYADHGGWSVMPSATVSTLLRAATDYTGRCTLSGLKPSSRYELLVETADGPPRSGSFNTPAPPDRKAACSFVFGSCVGGQGYGRVVIDGDDTSPHGGFPVFGTMLAASPDFFVCNGDVVYADNAIDAVASQPWLRSQEHVVASGMGAATDLDGFRSRYQYHYADPKLAAFYANVPSFATWDDHEITDDWGAQALRDRGDGDLLEAGMRAWFEYNVHTGPPEEPRRVYRSAQWGKHCELFILDCRSYRAPRDVDLTAAATATPQMKTMLGAEQLHWLATSLGRSSATWKFICTSVPLSYPTGWPRPAETGYDGWADGAAGESVGPEAELKSILKLIADEGIRNVVFISGDVHFPFALSYDPFQQGKPLVHEIGATPLHALCLPSPPNGPGDTSLHPTTLYTGSGSFGSADQNFGRCAIAIDGVATFTLHEAASGALLYELRLHPE